MNRNNLSYSSWIFYIIAIVELSLLLTSCAMHNQYPSSWGGLITVEENKCTDISGIYRNTGEKEKGVSEYKLSKILGFKDEIGETHVKITQLKDDTFEISGWDTVGDEQKLVYKKSYPERKYSCTPEGVKASSHTESTFVPEGLGAFGTMTGSFYLTKNTDGDLVVKDTGTVIGLSMLIIPMIGAGTDWYRFPHEDLSKK